MKVGDLVEFMPDSKGRFGGLVAIKYFERIKKTAGGNPGVIVEDNGDSCVVLFGDTTIVINKNHLEVISESGS